MTYYNDKFCNQTIFPFTTQVALSRTLQLLDKWFGVENARVLLGVPQSYTRWYYGPVEGYARYKIIDHTGFTYNLCALPSWDFGYWSRYLDGLRSGCILRSHRRPKLALSYPSL